MKQPGSYRYSALPSSQPRRPVLPGPIQAYVLSSPSCPSQLLTRCSSISSQEPGISTVGSPYPERTLKLTAHYNRLDSGKILRNNGQAGFQRVFAEGGCLDLQCAFDGTYERDDWTGGNWCVFLSLRSIIVFLGSKVDATLGCVAGIVKAYGLAGLEGSRKVCCRISMFQGSEEIWLRQALIGVISIGSVCSDELRFAKGNNSSSQRREQATA